MYKHILIPTDGSELSEQAINYGVDLAKGANAKVTGITVSTPFQIYSVAPGALTDRGADYVVTAGGDGTALKALHAVLPLSEKPVFSMHQ